MRRLPLIIPFLIAFFATCFSSAILPKVHLMTFVPFFALAYMRKTLPVCLLIAIVCGVFHDMLTSTPWGMYTAVYFLVTIAAHRLERYYFEEKLYAIPLFTFTIAVICRVCESVMFNILGTRPLSKELFNFPHMLLLSGCDVIYAIVVFSIPLFILARIIKFGRIFLLGRQVVKWNN